MADKKGKGLVQKRHSLKQQMAGKYGHIEDLKTKLIHQEGRDVGRVIKLKSDLWHLIKERDQVEFLIETSYILHRVIEAVDKITIPVGRWLKERREKKKVETRAHNAQLRAALFVVGVAAAVATITATIATSSTSRKKLRVA